MTIAALTLQCLDAFQNSLASSLKAQDQLPRFNLWVSNNDVFLHDRLSLDHKVRRAVMARDMIVELLNDLKSQLGGIAALQPHKGQPSLLEGSATSPIQEEASPWAEIATTISRLFQVCTATRRTGILTRYAKAARYVAYDESGTVDLSAKFTSLIQNYLLRVWPDMNPQLRDRLRDTISLRQRTFSYLKARKAAAEAQNPVEDKELPKAPFSGPDDRASRPARHRPAVRSTASSAAGPSSRPPKAPKRTGVSEVSGTSIYTQRTQPSPSKPFKNLFPDTVADMVPVLSPPKIPPGTIEMECTYCFLVYPATEFRDKETWM